MIEVLQTPPLNSVQDLGRFGVRHLGCGTSGVMDPLAFSAGNRLLGNGSDAACIEVQTFPFRVRFTVEADFAVCGADSGATLDDRALPPWWATRARAGQQLTLRPPRHGARAYLNVAGGIDVPLVLGSRSTYMRSAFGGFEGRALQEGDRIATLTPACGPHWAPAGGLGALPADAALPPLRPAGRDDVLCVRVLPAGDLDLYPPEAQRIFWQTDWKITFQSDRAGYRLSGAALKLPAPVEKRSYGLVNGIVQVPPSGQPIIQLSDANTAGGYPKIATVIDADLWRLGQASAGSFLRFVRSASRKRSPRWSRWSATSTTSAGSPVCITRTNGEAQ